jgi:hypothetical protein
MTREVLADRIISYCDALAAFSLVNALAFVITLAEPDIRCSIAGIAGAVAAVNVLIAVLVSVALNLLRGFEQSLRSSEAGDPRVIRFWRYMQGLRLAIVWGVVALVCFGLWAATLDPNCANAALASSDVSAG